MKKCTSCGYENEDEALYCGKCGQKMNSCPPPVTSADSDLGFTLDNVDSTVVKEKES